MTERGLIVDGIRRALRGLRADGLDWIGPRRPSTPAPVAEPHAEPPARPGPGPRPGAAFRPRVAALENLDPASLWVTVPDPHPNGAAMAAFTTMMVPELNKLLDGLCRDEGKGCR